MLFVHLDEANEPLKLTIPATTPQNVRVPVEFYVGNRTFLYLRQSDRFCEVVEVNDAQPQVESEAAEVKGEGPPAVPATDDKKPHDGANDSSDGEADHVSVVSDEVSEISDAEEDTPLRKLMPKSAKGTRQKEPAASQEEPEADDDAKENAPLRKLMPKSAKGTRQKEPAATQEEPEADDDAEENAPLRKLMTAKKRKASLKQVTSHSKVILYTDRIVHN